MGRNTGRDDFDLTRLPTEQEVADFDPYLGDECCTLQNFKVDLRKNPRSEYNQSAARVFAHSFNSCQSYTKRSPDLLVSMFHTHLEQLQTLFRLKVQGAGQVGSYRHQHRSDARKLKVGGLSMVGSLG